MSAVEQYLSILLLPPAPSPYSSLVWGRAILYNVLLVGLYERCGAVFEHLAVASCSTDLDETRRPTSSQPPQLTATAATAEKKSSPASVISSVLGGRPKLARLHAAHALSMDVLLGMALEMGMHTHACWKHVFRLIFTARTDFTNSAYFIDMRAARFLAHDSIYAIVHYMPSPVHLSVRPSVCLTVCPSHGWISQRRLKLGSRNLHHRVAP